MSNFTDEDMEKLAEALGKALQENKSPCDYCATSDRRQAHREDHEFVASCRDLANDLKEIRWGFFKRIIQVSGWIVLVWVAMTIWDHGVVEWLRNTIQGK